MKIKLEDSIYNYNKVPKSISTADIKRIANLGFCIYNLSKDCPYYVVGNILKRETDTIRLGAFDVDSDLLGTQLRKHLKCFPDELCCNFEYGLGTVGEYINIDCIDSKGRILKSYLENIVRQYIITKCANISDKKLTLLLSAAKEINSQDFNGEVLTFKVVTFASKKIVTHKYLLDCNMTVNVQMPSIPQLEAIYQTESNKIVQLLKTKVLRATLNTENSNFVDLVYAEGKNLYTYTCSLNYLKAAMLLSSHYTILAIHGAINPRYLTYVKVVDDILLSSMHNNALYIYDRLVSKSIELIVADECIGKVIGTNGKHIKEIYRELGIPVRVKGESEYH